MNTIQKLNTNNYYITINHKDILPADVNINFIIFVDNKHLPNNITRIIVQKLPALLEKYFKSVKKLTVSLIVNYKSLKVINISMQNLYTEFRKIICKKVKADIEVEKQHLECEVVKKLIDTNKFNEIIYFSQFSNVMIYESINKLSDSCNSTNTRISLVINNKSSCYLDNKIKLYTENEDKDTFYKNMIDNGIFLTNPIIHNSINIKLPNTTKILMTDNIQQFYFDNYLHNCIIIDNHIDQLDINGINFDLKSCDKIKFLTDTEEINVLHSLLSIEEIQLSVKLCDYIKECLLKYINKPDNAEIKNKSYYLYQLLREKYMNIVSEIINNKSNKEDNDNIKSLFEYNKKSLTNMNVHYSFQNIIQNYIIKNISELNIDPKINNNSTTDFINSYDNILSKNSKFEESCDFFVSTITLSNWFDELESDNGIGFLVKTKSNDLAKIGVSPVKIKNITDTMLSITDFISITVNFFQKNKQHSFGDLNNKNIIQGSVIGDANILIPLYINKYHWNTNKKYLKQLLSICVSHNSLSYTNKYQQIYYTIFLYMTKQLFNENGKYLNEKFIKLYIAYLRTCLEICIENKHNTGIRNLISQILSDPKMRISKNDYVYDNIIAQTLITGYVLEENSIQKLILYTLEESIRNHVKYCEYDTEFAQYFCNLEDDNLINIEIATMLQYFEDELQDKIKYLIVYYKINSIIKIILEKHGGYNRFIKLIDKNFGLIDNDTVKLILDHVDINLFKNSDITFEKLYQIVNLPYNKYSIVLYIIQGIKHINNKDRLKDINNKKYIDPQTNSIVNLNTIKSIFEDDMLSN